MFFIISYALLKKKRDFGIRTLTPKTKGKTFLEHQNERNNVTNFACFFYCKQQKNVKKIKKQTNAHLFYTYFTRICVLTGNFEAARRRATRATVSGTPFSS